MLHFNQLTGEISPEIGNLTNLAHLYLSYKSTCWRDSRRDRKPDKFNSVEFI